MRILYPVLWARPGRKACQAQTVATAAAFARRGHDVTLMLPKGVDDPPVTAGQIRDWFGVTGGFRVVQHPSRWEGEAFYRTVFWMRQVFRSPDIAGVDLIYSRIPGMFALGGFSPLPFATDHYRPWPDVHPVTRGRIRRTARHPDCLGLVIHSHHAARAYRRAGVPDDRILVAHNGFDPPEHRLGKAAARERLGLPLDQPIVVYAGRIDGSKGLDSVLALAELRPSVLFVLVGSESHGPIERAASRLANVQIAPWADPAALPAWLYAADALVIPPSSAPLERFGTCVLPIKLFSYLAARRPILAPAAPDTAELLEHGTNAWLVPPDRPAQAAEALDRLLGDEGLAARLSNNALELSERLSWDRRAEAIEAFLKARLAQRSEYKSTVTPMRLASGGTAQALSTEGT